MEPKNYSTIRSILKKEQGEKIAPLHFQNKWYSDTGSLSKKRKDYLWNLPRRKIITSKGTLSQNHEEFGKKRKLEGK